MSTLFELRTSSNDLYTQVFKTYQLIKPYLQQTPLLESKINHHNKSGIFLKCENLQFTNSFKFRGALAAILSYKKHNPDIWKKIKKDGVITCSSGNFAIGLAKVAALFNINYSVIMHENVEISKIKLVQEINPNTNIIKVKYDAWRHIMLTDHYVDSSSFFISPETDSYVALGNATIAIELLAEHPDIKYILVPYGGGNLAYSIASLVIQMKSHVKVYVVETEAGAPFTASYHANKPVEVPYVQSFIDGIGSNFVIPSQFNRLKDIVSGALLVSIKEVEEALVDLLFIDKMMLEGAGAATFAAAKKYAFIYDWKNICCLLTGGNINYTNFLTLLKNNLNRYATHDIKAPYEKTYALGESA